MNASSPALSDPTVVAVAATSAGNHYPQIGDIEQQTSSHRYHPHRQPDTQTPEIVQIRDTNDHRNRQCNDTPSRDTESQAGIEDENNQAFLVKWEEGEKSNPRNFSSTRKAFLTFMLGMLALSASLGSSIIAPAKAELSDYLQISPEATVLTVSLYVLGFAVG